MPVDAIKKYRIPLQITSWAVFAISLALYWITADSGASYWDCPEYIVAASRLEIGHPPGNPIWMLAMRVATLPFSAAHHAYVINLSSGMFMAFAVFFLCRVIFIPTRIFFYKSDKKFSPGYANFLASLVAGGAALTYAFCDSAWFSAVEAEVYAMSAFLSALSLWIMVLWWWREDEGRRTRLLILLAYITGLSLGVHQLNLLLIPVYALIILYKKFPGRLNPVVVLFCIGGSCGLIALILMVLIPASLFGAQSFELFGVNNLGLPYHWGTGFFCIIIFLLIVISLIFFSNPRFPIFSNIRNGIWMFAFLLLGFSSFAIIMIRAQAAPLMNEGVPDNIFSLTSYIGREQYPSSPLLYGRTPYSKPLIEEEIIDGKPYYSRYILEKEKAIYQPVMPSARLNHRSGMLSHLDSAENLRIIGRGNGYLLSDYSFRHRLTPELNMWFPRLTSGKSSDIQAYEDWAGASKQSMEEVWISETEDANGHPSPKLNNMGQRIPHTSYRPTYAQNLKFFIAYQAYYMYFRYLFWNFIGRQNNMPSMGEIEHGNFITGFPPIDRYLGYTDKIPQEIGSENPGRNIYLGIPFIIGIIGIFTLLVRNRRSRRMLSVITLLFLMTGLAIVVYLNQSPGEPRERDYTFLVSYMAFCMWIAAGILALAIGGWKALGNKACIMIAALFSLGIPTLMAIENFDDHDRRGRFATTYYVSSILDFEYPALIFSQGDNSSFPLWYASEVLEMGKEHTPIDITYLSLPSYVVNLKKQGVKGINTLTPTPNMAYGAYLLTKLPLEDTTTQMAPGVLLRKLLQEESANAMMPSSYVTLPSSSGDSITINLRDFTKRSAFLGFRHLMLLDLIAMQLESSEPKILFFPSLMDYSFYKPLEPVLTSTPFGKIYAPWLSDSIVQKINRNVLERELNKMKGKNFKANYNDPLTAERTSRYRGELVIAARERLARGDTAMAVSTAEMILNSIPYHELPPGNFTVTDSTFYEGKEFQNLLMDLYEGTKEIKFVEEANKIDSITVTRRKQWIDYYNSLQPHQRKTLSNRSRRLLK